MRSHNLEHKPSKRKRKFRKEVEVTPADYKALRQMLRVKK
jgi:ribosomal protein L35